MTGSRLLTVPCAQHKLCRSPSVPGTQGVSSGHAAPHSRSTPTDTSEVGREPGRKYIGSCLCLEKYIHSLTGKPSFEKPKCENGRILGDFYSISHFLKNFRSLYSHDPKKKKNQ